MSRRTTLAGITGLCATLAACSGSPAPPPPQPVAAVPAAPPPAVAAPAPAMAPRPAVPAAAAQPAAKPPAPAQGAAGKVMPAQPVAAITQTAQAGTLMPAAPAVPQSDVPAYETKGRRDPFTTLEVVTGPSGLTVATTKLTGIVRGSSTLALVETPDGIGYILRAGDTLGDGRLVEIGADNVVFAVAAKPGAPPSRVVLKLAAK